MELSITVATYNSREITCAMLDSLFTQTTGLTFEVLVVDNASVDGSADAIASRFPAVRLIRSERNLGFAAAHNLALAQAQGDFLMVLNSDVLFQDNAVKAMVDDLRQGAPTLGVVGPQVLNRDLSLAPSSRRRIFYPRVMVGLSVINQYFPYDWLLPQRWLRRYAGALLGRVHDNFDPPRVAQEVEWLDGICVMFKRAVLDQAGLFDEQFFFDYEIGDLLVRAQDQGWRILFDPAINIIHLGGYSRTHFQQIRVNNQRSQLIYYAKHRPSYVPMIQRLTVSLIGLKLALLRFQRAFAADRQAVSERAQILEATREIYRSFDPQSVAATTKVPRLNNTVPT